MENTGTPVSDRQKIRTDTPAGQFYYKFLPEFSVYHVERPIPLSVFRQDYPENPRTFGECLRKLRIDAGLQIKDLARELGVTEDSVINWEIRGMIPARKMNQLFDKFPGLKEFPDKRGTSSHFQDE